jgi:hypothetical protein
MDSQKQDLVEDGATYVLLFGDVGAGGKVHEQYDDSMKGLNETCNSPEQVR